ncbi:hypothetical protein [Streptomyces sp. NPDC058657]|uniref:hypothetical protein n=1 Tax=unclassified Streptomyces TaxID=2593676 RepID=UPI00365A1371
MSAPTFGSEGRHVAISADGPMARVVLEGADISEQVSGYTLEHRAGQRPMLVLYAAADATDFDGLAEVVVAAGPDPGPALAAFLANVDPVALHQAALNRDDLDGTRHELTRAMLAQLAEWAQGGGGS